MHSGICFLVFGLQIKAGKRITLAVSAEPVRSRKPRIQDIHSLHSTCQSSDRLHLLNLQGYCYCQSKFFRENRGRLRDAWRIHLLRIFHVIKVRDKNIFESPLVKIIQQLFRIQRQIIISFIKTLLIVLIKILHSFNCEENICREKLYYF